MPNKEVLFGSTCVGFARPCIYNHFTSAVPLLRTSVFQQLILFIYRYKKGWCTNNSGVVSLSLPVEWFTFLHFNLGNISRSANYCSSNIIPISLQKHIAMGQQFIARCGFTWWGSMHWVLQNILRSMSSLPEASRYELKRNKMHHLRLQRSNISKVWHRSRFCTERHSSMQNESC